MPGVMIPLNDKEGKDRKSQTPNTSQDFIIPCVAQSHLLVKDVIGDVIDGHGDHGDNFQRTAAEDFVKHKVVLHIPNHLTRHHYGLSNQGR